MTGALERLEAAIPANPPRYAEMLPGGEIEFETQVIGATLLSATGHRSGRVPTCQERQRWSQTGSRRVARMPTRRADRRPLAIAAFWHEDALSGALSLFAPAPQERIEATFDADRGAKVPAPWPAAR